MTPLTRAEQQAQRLEALELFSHVLTAINDEVNRDALTAGAAALRASAPPETTEEDQSRSDPEKEP